MLTHKILCINILFSTQFKPFILSKFDANNTWTFLVQPSKSGLFLTVPKIVRGLSVDRPLLNLRFHFFGTEIHDHFWPNNTQNHNLHTNNAYGPITVRKSVSGLPKTVLEFHHFGPKFWDRPNGHSRPHTTQTINKALKLKNKLSRRRPLPLGVIETPQNWYPRVALAVGSNFASCLTGNRRSDRWEI